MRYGIISDVHANLEALNAVLERLNDVDAILCPGDIVGYGANPNECCAILRDLGATIVLGNHDAVCVGRMDIEWFNPHAQAAALWTAEHLAKQHSDYLLDLPLVERRQEFVVVHGSLAAPPEFEYITGPSQACRSFADMGEYALCFVGHTHVAEFYAQRIGNSGADQTLVPSPIKVRIKPGFHYIVNCGSVGQPRDGIPLASCGVYDTDSGTVEIIRVEYDIETAQAKMRDSGLPEVLWQRLEFGM